MIHINHTQAVLEIANLPSLILKDNYYQDSRHLALMIMYVFVFLSLFLFSYFLLLLG